MYSSEPSFDSSLVLKDSGSSSTSPSRLPRMLVEYQPDTPSRRALKAGARTVFMKVWPVLKSLPQMGAAFFFESSIIAGISTVRFGAPLAKGTPSAECGVGIDLRGRDADVVGLKAFLKGLDATDARRSARGRFQSSRTRSSRRGRRSFLNAWMSARPDRRGRACSCPS